VVSWACLLLFLATEEEAAFPSSWAFLSLAAAVVDMVVADILVVVLVEASAAVAVADDDGALPINSLPAAEMMMLMMQVAPRSTELVSFAQQEAWLADR
jgi:hypothetical protein